MKYFSIKKDFHEVVHEAFKIVPEELMDSLNCHSIAELSVHLLKEKGYNPKIHDGIYNTPYHKIAHSWITVGPFILSFHRNIKIDRNTTHQDWNEVIMSPFKKSKYKEADLGDKKIISPEMEAFLDDYLSKREFKRFMGIGEKVFN